MPGKTYRMLKKQEKVKKYVEQKRRGSLPCGCIPGYFLCRDAIRLWNIYLQTDINDETGCQKAMENYNQHFENQK